MLFSFELYTSISFQHGIDSKYFSSPVFSVIFAKYVFVLTNSNTDTGKSETLNSPNKAE